MDMCGGHRSEGEPKTHVGFGTAISKLVTSGGEVGNVVGVEFGERDRVHTGNISSTRLMAIQTCKVNTVAHGVALGFRAGTIGKQGHNSETVNKPLNRKISQRNCC